MKHSTAGRGEPNANFGWWHRRDVTQRGVGRGREEVVKRREKEHGPQFWGIDHR